MKERVLQQLTRIEQQYGVRVLLSVESGSRAWGFASPDSDYDVRFVYVHERDWYLSLFEDRDVIEEMLPDRLDVSGWDLRKTLRLFAKCNYALNEWLGSPVTYFEAPGFRGPLAAMIPRYFNPIRATHNYRSMGKRALAEHLADGQISIKKLFYVLRPLLACRWIHQTCSQPPTEFQKLVAPSWVTEEEKHWIATLLEQKSVAAEAHAIELDEGRANNIRSELEGYKSDEEALRVGRRGSSAELNAFFREFVLKTSR